MEPIHRHWAGILLGLLVFFSSAGAVEVPPLGSGQIDIHKKIQESRDLKDEALQELIQPLSLELDKLAEEMAGEKGGGGEGKNQGRAENEMMYRAVYLLTAAVAATNDPSYNDLQKIFDSIILNRSKNVRQLKSFIATAKPGLRGLLKLAAGWGDGVDVYRSSSNRRLSRLRLFPGEKTHRR